MRKQKPGTAGTDDKANLFTGERAMPFAPNMDPSIMREHWARYQYASSFVSGKRVLDIACGAGYGSHFLAQTAAQVTGGDISPETISYCRNHYQQNNLTYEVMDIREIPLPDKSLDVIISFESLEHIIEGELFLAEIIRLLTPDGTLLISTPLGGPVGNPHHVAYYQRGTFAFFLRNFFDDVQLLYQRDDAIGEAGKSPEYSPTFTGEYAVGICKKPKARLTGLTSIIVVMPENRETLSRCIASIRSHTTTPHEILIADPGLHGNVGTLLSSVEEVPYRLIPCGPDADIGSCINRAMVAARGEFAALLDVDAMVTEGWLTRMLDALRNHPEAGLVVPMLNADTTNAGCCFVARRALIDRIGGLDTNLTERSLAYTDLAKRAALSGFTTLVAQDTFVNQAHCDPNRTVSPPVGDPSKFYIPLPYPVFSFERALIPNMVSLVILTFNELNTTKECVAGIQKHTSAPHEIIFIDNGSTDGTVKWLTGLVQKHQNYRLIRNRENLGFAKGCNQGIIASAGEYILLLNNDVVVTRGWLDNLLKTAVAVPDVGIVGPMTNNISGIQKVGNVPYKTTAEMEEFAEAFSARRRNQRIPSRRIVGFCMLFRRILAERIGLLDENFGSGNFEDDDYCLRSTLEGFRNMIAGDVFIHHYGSRSFIGNKIHYGSAMAGNKKIYRAKWGAINADSKLGRKLLVAQALEKAGELFHRDRSDEAMAVLIDAIKYAPDNARIYAHLAHMLLEAKQFEQALEVIDRAPSHDADAAWLCLAGYCREGLGSHEEAAELARRALLLLPGYAPAINLQGVLAFRKEDRVSAEALFRKAMEADPGYGEPFTNLGVLLWSKGDQQAGLDFLEKGFVLAPLSSDAASLYHSAGTASGAFSAAERAFREACLLYPDLRRTRFLLIDLVLRQERYDEALALTHEAMMDFGIDDGILAAALDIRSKIGAQKTGPAIKNEDTLSVCMIVRNEEAHLLKCLMSIAALADEIIIVDTGSEDRTQDIARSFGAKVSENPWTGDFSEARNASIEKAGCGWIFILDADEVIAPRDHTALKKLIQATTKRPAAYTVTTRNYITAMNISGWTANDGTYGAEEAGSGWNPSAKVRLFTNDPRIRFGNRVHELVEPSLARINVEPKPCAIPVHHYGKLKEEKVMTKGEDYFLLGREKLRETNDAKALYELALQAGELDRFSDAIELWGKFLRLPDVPQELVLKAYVNIGHAFVQTGKFDEAFSASKKAIALAPGSASAVINYGLSELWMGDPQRAVPFLEDLLKSTPDYPPAIGLLAVASLASGRADAAQRLFAQLKTQGFLHEPYLLNHAHKLIAAGRADRAAALLEAAVASGLGSSAMDGMLIECRERSANVGIR